MSGSGAPLDEQIPDGTGLKVAVVAGSWHEQVMRGLIDSATKLIAEAGAESELIRVPGAFELPVVSAQYARTHDAVVALGVVIRGGTPHFEFVAGAATSGLTRVALDSDTPVGFGLLTTDDDDQALDRAGLPGSAEDKGREAALAALQTAVLLRDARLGKARGLGF